MILCYSTLDKTFIPLLLKLRKLGEREIKETMKNKIRRRDAVSGRSHYKDDLTADAVASIQPSQV